MNKNKRLELHQKLVDLFGNDHVYYRPPENLKREYPCIQYKKDDIELEHADNIAYRKTDRYVLTIIDKKPDNPVINKLLDLPMCSFNTHYETNGFNHDVLTIYY